jgi:hypothetical protein
MRGKTGHWGKPFTKENANAMRQRGLNTRRSNSADRLRELCRDEETKGELRETRPRPSQPSSPPRSDAAEMSPAVEAKPARTDIAPVPILQPGEEIGYGYELAPGVWVEAKPTAPPTNGRAAAAEAVARARQSVRRWDGKRPYGRPT